MDRSTEGFESRPIRPSLFNEMSEIAVPSQEQDLRIGKEIPDFEHGFNAVRPLA